MLKRIAMILALLFPAVASGQTVCPSCGQIHAVQQVTMTLPGQAVAQARANHMARFNIRTHPRGVVSFSTVGNFEGVGWNSARVSRESIATCRPSGPSGAHPDGSRQLVGDAVAYGPNGSYRVRIWGGPVAGATQRVVEPVRSRVRLLRQR